MTPPLSANMAHGIGEREGELAELIRAKMTREGLSLRDAGDASGVAFSTLGRIANGATPSLKVDRQIRAWLGGSTRQLPEPPMALRDWFAGHALSGLIAAHAHPAASGQPDPDDAAKWAHQYADAMLIARALPAA